MPSARALSQAGARPSGRVIEAVDSEETEVVYFEEPIVAEVSLGYEAVEPDVES